MKIKKILLEGQYFEYAFLIAMMSISIPVVHQYVGPFAKITLLWGGICILYDLLVTKRIFQCKYGKLLLAFGAVWLFSVLLGFQDNLVRNLVFFSYGIIYIWLLYPKYVNEGFKTLARFLTSYCVLTFLASLVSLIMFVTLFRTVVADAYITGYHMGRLYGVYVSPNTGGMYAFLAIVASVMILCKKDYIQKKWIKILHYINIFVQVSYISLTDSKGTTITYLAFAFLVGFGIVYVRNYKATAKNIILSIVAGGCFAIISIVGTHLIGTAYSYVPALINNVEHGVTEEDEALNEKLEAIAIKRQYEDEEITSGRVEIWKVGLELIKENPLFGTPRETMPELAEELVPDQEEVIVKLHSGMHNLYMETLVETGLIGGILFFSFIILIAIAIIKAFFTQFKGEKDILIKIIFIGFIAGMAGNNFGECTILFCQSGIGIVFWLFLGYGMSKWIQNKKEVSN